MKNLKICNRCGNKYWPNRSDQMYCSKGCRLREYAETAKVIREDERRLKQKKTDSPASKNQS